MLKVIFFDAAGTLIHLGHSGRGVGFHYNKVANRHGLIREPEAWENAFRAVWKTMPVQPPTGEPRADDDRGWWRDLVMRMLKKMAISETACDREALFNDLYTHFAKPGVWELFPEVTDVLKQCNAHFRLGIISNFDSRLFPVLEQLGVAHFFEQIIISSRVGAEKPESLIFKTALEKMQVANHEALHVGDHPAEDWRGAEAAGLRAFHLKRPENSLHDLLALVEKI